ncbi:hypothetical protein PIROE2DRAFT_16800 [Piromyces sp. E2]|nr:hypothetical protein PIROE2DRAFT_16800 [Piromyces sp. E2]|eukprot:OUM58040.1 hypothetical protein PIROE2DRAFT_16800 [Piromyces sp. E2]
MEKKGLPFTSKISWSLCNKIPKKLESKKTKNLDIALNPVSKDFFNNYLISSSTLFNLCISWNINGWNSLIFQYGVLYLNSLFKPALILHANPKIPGMKGLYIGVHSSCSFFQEPFIYKYIISGNITLLESEMLYRFHYKNNNPAVLVGDFNMSLNKIKSYISNHFSNWYITPLSGNQFTYAKGTRSSCIDHIIYN